MNTQVIKVKDMMPGNYQILSYDARQSQYGRTFIIEAIGQSDNDEIIHFWSTSYLTNYLLEFQPKKKFNIGIKDGLISIDGYNRKIILM